MYPSELNAEEVLTESIFGVVDAACDAFEASWKLGERPSIQGAVLAGPDKGRHRLLVELLALDVEYRVLAGESPKLSEYEDLFPQFTNVVAAAFPDAIRMLPARPRIPVALITETAMTNHRDLTKTNHSNEVVDVRIAEHLPSQAPAVPYPGFCSDKSFPQIDNFEIHEKIGSGGMGVVYRARDLRLNRHVALKIVLGGNQFSDQQVIRLEREAETLAKLRHPHIVQIHSVGTWEEIPYLTMEYMEGGTLDKLVRNHRVSVRWSVEFVAKLADAMQYAHEHGVVHRDLKPSNILLLDLNRENAGRLPSNSAADEIKDQSLSPEFGASSSAGIAPRVIPKIADFGLARDLTRNEPQSLTGQIIGTANFMAPEQALGQRALPSADIYSIGAILYFLLTEHPPFEGRTPLETLLMVQQSPPTPVSWIRHDLPAELNAICMKCLEKDPASRYASAKALSEDLNRYLNGEPLLARPAGPLRNTMRWMRRRPVFTSLLTTFVAITLVGIPLAWNLHRQSEVHVRNAITAQWRAETELAAARADAESERRAKLEALDALRVARQSTIAAESARRDAQQTLREAWDNLTKLRSGMKRGRVTQYALELSGEQLVKEQRAEHDQQKSVQSPDSVRQPDVSPVIP